jgi:hypothetical protein
MPNFEFFIGKVVKHFTNLVIVAKKIEQTIKKGKIKGPTMKSEVMMEHELGNGSQIMNLGRSNITLSSVAQTTVLKIDIPFPLKDIYHLLNARHIIPPLPDLIKSLIPRRYNLNEKCK